MLTNPGPIEAHHGETRAAATRKVVIVNGNARTLAILETVLEAGHYDVVFVESSEHAYSNIREHKPELVILCVRMEDAEGCLLLSMLKLDEETSLIPILTCAAEPDDEPSTEDEPAESGDTELFQVSRAMQMN